MISSLQNFLESLRIETIILVTFMYLMILWLLVPIWVYVDANKRFKDKRIARLLFVLVLPFNIPALIFYIIIRPELDSEVEFSGEDHLINVPMVKFIDQDKNDFIMSFELKINGNKMNANPNSNMSVNLSIEPDEETVTIVEYKDENKDKSNDEKIELGKEKNDSKKDKKSIGEKLRNTLSEVKGFFIPDKTDSDDESEEDEQDDEDEDSNDLLPNQNQGDNQNNHHHKKKKKKKKRR